MDHAHCFEPYRVCACVGRGQERLENHQWVNRDPRWRVGLVSPWHCNQSEGSRPEQRLDTVSARLQSRPDLV